MTTHPPVVVNNECEYIKGKPSTRENIKIQCKCGLDHFIRFLNKLKKKGIYESSLIILQADHGLGEKIIMRNMNEQIDKVLSTIEVSLPRIAGSASALMAIKPPYSKGILKISKAQTALTDIPATISALLNMNEKFEGRSVFEIDPNEVRERKFYYYKWKNENWQSTYFHRLDEFIIKGSLFDRSSWEFASTYYPPEK
jgi:phosphoglycerol transferase MdoB-like AlkP superfamily enzyme